MKKGFLILFALLFLSCVARQERIVYLHSENIISKNFIGNGVQWSAYPHADTENAEWGKLMTDAKWQMNFDRLDYIKPKLFRVIDQANWRYMVGFDASGNPILDFNTPEIKALEKILDYAQKHNISVLFGEWGTPYKMHDVNDGHSDKFTGASDPKWINSIVEYLDYLIIERGYTCLKYYNLINEPNGDWASTKGDFNEWRDGVKLLAKAIKEKGLDKYITIAGPDAVTRYDNPRSTYSGIGWVEESIKQIGDDIGLYEIHDYTSHELVKTGNFKNFHRKAVELAESVNKQIVFGEIGLSRNTKENQERAKQDEFASEDSQMEVYDFSYGIYMADAAIQAMNAGFSGSAAWDLDDAMHTKDDTADKHKIKRWGMWNSLGTELCNNPKDENIRPWFYTWSLMCRYFPTGSKIIKTDSTEIEGVRLTASKFKDEISIALVNNSDMDGVVNLSIPTSKSLKKYLYQEGNSKVDKNNFPVAIQTEINAKGISKVNIPANSFILFTTLKF